MLAEIRNAPHERTGDRRQNPMSASSSDSPDGSPSVLQVEVNGEALSLDWQAGPRSVARLLEILDLGGKRVAVAVNRVVVVRSRYPELELSDGDRIEILEAVGGG
jgi:sulfur carrier protein